MSTLESSRSGVDRNRPIPTIEGDLPAVREWFASPRFEECEVAIMRGMLIENLKRGAPVQPGAALAMQT